MTVIAMQLIITPGGAVRCIYGEEIDLAALGSPTITRASHVEPDQQGRWLADLSPVGGPCWGRSIIAARPWRPSRRGWRPTGLRLRRLELLDQVALHVGCFTSGAPG